jgi:hypothetical protein
MTTDHAPRKPGSGKGQILQIAVDFDGPVDLTSTPAAVVPPQAQEKEGPLTAEEQNEILVLALKDIVGICTRFEHPPAADLFSMARNALKAVGRESESCTARVINPEKTS